MGFKILKKSDHKYQRRIQNLKQSAIEKEVKIWSNLTSNNKGYKQLLERFIELAEQTQENEENSSHKAEKIGKNIEAHKIDLVAIQGQIILERLHLLIKE